MIPTLAIAGSGKWNPFRKRPPEPEPVVMEEPAPEPEPEPVPRLAGPLFDGVLPLDPGPLPTGLAHASAQGCHACHPTAYAGWKTGPHAGPVSERLLAAVADTGISACASCHLPLVSQHATTPAWEVQEARPPQRAGFDATLHLEGVTCAACHVREGRVAVTTEAAARAVGPHIVAQAPELASPEACATCHQLTWPGANVPLYDTYGEWKRSAWADAGVTCLDCHRSDDAPHAWSSDPSRALSVLLETRGLTVVRGDASVEVAITLQNTGAGHAYPSGTPFAGLRLHAHLEDPDGKVVGEPLSADLARTLQDEPPWATVSDTRLAPGESRTFDFEAPVGVQQPAGRWALVVILTPTLYGQADDTPVITRRLPLWVE